MASSYLVYASARPQLVAHQHALRLSLRQLALVHRRLHLHLEIRLHLPTTHRIIPNALKLLQYTW